MLKAVGAFLAICVVPIVVIVGYYIWAMSYRHVTETDSWVSFDVARLDRKHLFDDFPATTKEIRYSNTVVGMRGRCFVYAIRAPLADLHEFASQQLKQYSGKIVRTNNSPSPFLERTPTDLRIVYAVHADWLLDVRDHIGVLYKLDSFGGPTIFVDEASETLYYVFTD